MTPPTSLDNCPALCNEISFFPCCLSNLAEKFTNLLGEGMPSPYSCNIKF